VRVELFNININRRYVSRSGAQKNAILPDIIVVEDVENTKYCYARVFGSIFKQLFLEILGPSCSSSETYLGSDVRRGRVVNFNRNLSRPSTRAELVR